MRALILVFSLSLLGCPSSEPPPAGLQAVAEGLDEALFSVRATGPDDVWLVGSDAGAGPAVLSWDGAGWTHHDSGALAGVDLWWSFPTSTTVYLAGSGGTIASLDRATGAIDRVQGPGTGVTFFGIWGPSEDDLWAVGAAIGAGEPPSIWRNVGGAWAEVDTTDQPFHDPVVSLFKVHGTGPDDVWIAGSGGLILHWDGATFTDVGPEDLDDNLLTVALGAAGPLVVGGLNQGVILEQDGDTWTNLAPDLAPALNGVCQGDGATAVGRWGGVVRRGTDGWVLDDRSVTLKDLHACLMTSDGALWAVGGHISSNPLNDGVIAYEGPAAVPAP